MLLAAVPSAICHSTFQQLWVGGVDQAGNCARTPLSNSPVTSVSSNDIRCNAGTKPVANLCTVPGPESQLVTGNLADVSYSGFGCHC